MKVYMTAMSDAEKTDSVLQAVSIVISGERVGEGREEEEGKIERERGKEKSNNYWQQKKRPLYHISCKICSFLPHP